MRQVQEIIYVVPEEREAFIEKHLNPPTEILQILWKHGIRNQFFYELNDLILFSFEYVGANFYKDMASVTAYVETQGFFVQKRRRDVPIEELTTTNWWAPLKKLGKLLNENPMPSKEDEFSMEERYHSMLSGFTFNSDDAADSISYDEDDWSESVHI